MWTPRTETYQRRDLEFLDEPRVSVLELNLGRSPKQVPQFVCNVFDVRCSLAECAIMVDFKNCAPVAQLDRASGYEPEGREFESLRAHHFPQ